MLETLIADSYHVEAIETKLARNPSLRPALGKLGSHCIWQRTVDSIGRSLPQNSLISSLYFLALSSQDLPSRVMRSFRVQHEDSAQFSRPPNSPAIVNSRMCRSG